jgi:hypothetical protein
MIYLILFTLFVQLKSDFDVQQTHLWGWFVELKLMLSLSIRCDQINKYDILDFVHTFLFDLSQTLMFNKHTSEAGLLK